MASSVPVETSNDGPPFPLGETPGLDPERIRRTLDECVERSNRTHETPFPFRLRRATVDDAGFIMELVQGLADYEKEPEAVHVDIRTYVRDGFATTHPAFYCVLLDLVVVENDERRSSDGTMEVPVPVGMAFVYVGFTARDGRLLYLEDLYVRPEHRGNGGGKALMYVLADWALQLQCPQLVWQALDWNTPALAFYQRTVGAVVRQECVPLRLERDAMERWRHTRYGSRDHATEVPALVPLVMETVLDECIARSNHYLTTSNSGTISWRYRLRRATIEDTDSILALLVRSGGENQPIRVGREEIVRDGFTGDHPLFHCVLLEPDDDTDSAAVGMAWVYLAYSTWDGRVLTLDECYVDEPYRDHGGGTSLLSTLIDVALTLDCRRLVGKVGGNDHNPTCTTLEQVGAKTLHEWWTLQLGRDAMVSFLSTRHG